MNKSAAVSIFEYRIMNESKACIIADRFELINCVASRRQRKLRDVTLVVILTRAGQRATNRRFIQLCHSCTLFFAKKRPFKK